MPQHASNSERIARAAAEAEARATEKAAAKKEKASKPKAPRASRSKSRASATPARRKIVWAVGKPGVEPVAEFAYPQRAEADAEAVKRGAEYMVVARRVPM